MLRYGNPTFDFAAYFHGDYFQNGPGGGRAYFILKSYILDCKLSKNIVLLEPTLLTA